MDADLPFISAEDLDAMTPNERLAAFQARIVTDPAAIPPDFRERIYESARQLGRERRTQ
ncbi:MAG: hypothetical protein KDB86_09685 [Actinobacteria bacterium]|nr:hypothetical protein [Actinomycetota bacterium]